MVTTDADLKRVLEEAEAALAARPLSARRRQALRLALDELLSNILRHAHADGGAHPVAVRLDLDEPMQLEIEDDGKPFDPARDAPPPVLTGPVEERPVGGLGLHLLRSLGVTLDHRRANGRNIVRGGFAPE